MVLFLTSFPAAFQELLSEMAPLLAKLLVLNLPNSFNENELAYPKHVKDFATQDDLN